MHALLTPLLVGVDDRFRVAACLVTVSARLEVAADLGMVVDFAVVRDPDRVVLVGERLLPRAQIDDAQTAMGEGRDAVAVESCFVRAAIRHDVAHRRRTRRRAFIKTIGGDYSRNAAHKVILLGKVA